MSDDDELLDITAHDDFGILATSRRGARVTLDLILSEDTED